MDDETTGEQCVGPAKAMGLRELRDALDDAICDPYASDESAVVLNADGAALAVFGVEVQTWKYRSGGGFPVAVELKVAARDE